MDIEFSENTAVAIIEASDGLRVYAFDDGNFTSNRLIPHIADFRKVWELWGDHPHVPKDNTLKMALRNVLEYASGEIETIRREEKPFINDDKIIY